MTAGIAFSTHLVLGSPVSWNVDFNEFYAAGKLVGTGHLYDWEAIRALELQHGTRAVPFGRIPAFAVFFWPLSSLPYAIARILWLAAGFGALAGIAILWPLRPWRRVAGAICWSVPALMCLTFGQDSVLLLLFVAVGSKLLLNGRDFWAGVALSGCLAKPHLAFLLPLLLVRRGKWDALFGGLAGGIGSMLLSFAVEGGNWPQRLLSLARTPEFSPAEGRMPTLFGALSGVRSSLAIEIPVAAAVIAAYWFLSRRLPLSRAAALAMAGGLLLSPHAYAYDAVLLLPALILYQDACYPAWLRFWGLLLMTPVPYLLLLSNTEWPGHIAVTGYTLALFAMEISRGRHRELVTAAANSG